MLIDADGTPVPYEVVEQGAHPTRAPFDASELTESLGGGSGSASMWFQPQWEEGNKDDASLLEIGDGQLRLVKNVNFLRLEFIDAEGAEHGLGAPITGWTRGEWHQIAGSWDTDRFELYFDGVLVRETTISGTFYLPEKPRLFMGSDFPDSRPVAPGMVGGLDVHRHPMSADEAMRLYAWGNGRSDVR